MFGPAPYEVDCHALLGSVLRLSQPLNGFLAHPNFVALFRATTIRGIPPSEISPRKSRAPLSGSTLLPRGYPPTCRNVASRSLSPPVSPTSTLSRSCMVPPTTMGSLFTLPKERFPVTLGPSDGTASFRSLHPPRSLNSSRESVHVDPGCPDSTADPLLGSCLSKAFSLHASDLEPAFARKLQHALSSEDSGHDSRDLAAPHAG